MSRFKIDDDTVVVGTGPITIDVSACREIGMTDDEISDASAAVHALSCIVQMPARRRARPGRFEVINKGCEFCTDVFDHGDGG